MQSLYQTLTVENGAPIKAWVKGVPFDPAAEQQLRNTAQLPFIYKWVAVMPDVHVGKGATVGSVVPTLGAIIPAAVGVDIGCGMMAVQTSLTAEQLPDNLFGVRTLMEKAVPHGRTHNGGKNDRGSWQNVPHSVDQAWQGLEQKYKHLVHKYPAIGQANSRNHLGTLGTGNHFIEMCLDEENRVWFMLHSGSRGVGNRIGTLFIELARKDMGRLLGTLPDRDLAYLKEGTTYFDDYVEAVTWAQDFARTNRQLMMRNLVEILQKESNLPAFQLTDVAVNCHHNYASREQHFGQDVWITRKGAVRAGKGELGIIPGSMGARSFIVRGLGNPHSFETCSHGAGRVCSRTEAKKRWRVEDHIKATEGVECRKDESVIDETPMAYKSIGDVINAQKDLIEVVHVLKQVVCVKG
ncbi:MAG: RtcB family protein [Acidobacteria bacterium]|nr:RtcB family protein [Acidobacteriota bacterium]MCB9397316.1 RtcB family protein [Acidobacteriota bacterium]